MLNKEIGIRMNKTRTSRNITLQELSDRLTDMGHPMSVQTLSKIENNQRRAYADQLYYICLAMDCSLGNIMPMPTAKSDLDHTMMAIIKSIPSDIKTSIIHILTRWTGNTTALFRFVGLYCALPTNLRKMIAEMGISVYNYAKMSNQIDSSAPPVNIVYITKETKKLE